MTNYIETDNNNHKPKVLLFCVNYSLIFILKLCLSYYSIYENVSFKALKFISFY